MKELLAAFLASIAELKTKANVVLAGLPPIEQFEATSEVASGLRCLRMYGQDLQNIADNLSGRIDGLVGQAQNILTCEAAKTAESALLATGDFIKKVDADAALNLAVESKATEVRGLITAELATAKLISDKRAKLIADKVLPLVVCEQLTDAVLGGEAADAHVAKISERIAKLTGLGLSVESAPLVFAELGGLPVDEAGDAAFGTRFATIEQMHAKPVKKPVVAVGAGAGGGTAFAVSDLV